jgi:competence protein ComFB
MIVNVREQLVLTAVEDVIAKEDCCKCGICYEDVCCIVLNNMPPLYKRLNDNKEYDTVTIANQRQTIMDIEMEALKAIEIVKRHPRH